MCTVTDCSVEKASSSKTSVMGRLTNEAAKRTVVLRGIQSGTERKAVEKFVGSLTRVRQLRYPFVMHDDTEGLCAAAVIYCGKRDALKAVQRFDSQSLAGFSTAFCFCLVHMQSCVWRCTVQITAGHVIYRYVSDLWRMLGDLHQSVVWLGRTFHIISYHIFV